MKKRLFGLSAVLLSSLLLFAASPVASALTGSISTNAIAWDTTDGDILTTTMAQVGSTRVLVIGGNFKNVITTDGVKHPAQNLAVLNAFTGAVVYAGQGINSYIRSVKAYNSVIYAGGDFTTFGGVARSRVAGVNVNTWAVTSFNPTVNSRVDALEVGTNALYVGGNMNTVRGYRYTDSTVAVSVPADCAIHTLLLSPDKTSLYIGGFQNVTNGFVQHGIAKVNATTGVVDTNFKLSVPLQQNTGTCGTAGPTGYDGENPISLVWDSATNNIVMGDGGHVNGLRVVNSATGKQVWGFLITNDGQAVAVAGSTYVVGIHGNKPAHNFIAQYGASNGVLTAWDPFLAGYQGNVDGGNNGTQAMSFDVTTSRLFVAGAFLTQNGTSRQSLAVFTVK